MVKSNVTKLDDGGYDVEFEGGGRVILSADDASNQKDAVKVATERLQQSGRAVGVDGDDPAAEKPTVVDESVDESDAEDVDASGDPLDEENK